MRWILWMMLLGGAVSARAQDTTLHFGAILDTYFGYDLPAVRSHRRAYLFTASQQNNMNVNLAAARIRYAGERFRFQTTPAVGTYMSANYAAEPSGSRFLVDGFGGLRLWKKVWLEAGVLPSPFSDENAISQEQQTYTRSLSAENSPYYLAGARLLFPLGQKLQVGLYVINGWQNIAETNASKSVAINMQYTPKAAWLLNWSAYAGNEQAHDSLGHRFRCFNDFYAQWSPSSRLKLSALCDIGLQQDVAAPANPNLLFWSTAHLIGSYRLTPQWRGNLRAELYMDSDGANVQSVTSAGPGVNLYGGSAGIDFMPDARAMLRFEARYLASDQRIFFQDANETNQRWWLTAALSVRLDK